MSTVTLIPVRPSAVPSEPEVTAEQLVEINGIGRQARKAELVDGRLVRKTMSFDANQVAGRFAGVLDLYLRQNPVGALLINQEYDCFLTARNRVRIPDLSFILTGRSPTPHPTGFLRFVPDLAVEIVSSNDKYHNDKYYNVDEKLEDYRRAGFPLTWVINPDSRSIRVYTLGQPPAEFRDGDTLTAATPLPGFVAAVADLMPPRMAA